MLQLHISEKTGRGVPKIVEVYGEKAFDFKDNAIVVTIPFDRLDLGGASPVTPSVTPRVTLRVDNLNVTGEKILTFCINPHSSHEIMEHLGLKDIKNIREHLKKLVEQGRLARTNPDKPNSSNQKYITIK